MTARDLSLLTVWCAAFLACILCGTYLVVTEHYGWAWIPYLLSSAVPAWVGHAK